MVACSALLASPLLSLAESINNASRSGKALPLQLVRSSDPEFSGLLETHFPGLGERKRFQRIQSTAIIVTNTGKRSVHGCTFRWTAITAKGHTQSYSRTFARHPTDNLKNRRQTARARFILPGEVVLVTPLFLWRAKNYTTTKRHYRLGRTSFRKYASRYEHGRGIIRHFKNAKAVNIKNESVVFHKKITGAKSHKTSKVLRNQQNGEHDEALYLRKVMKSHGIHSKEFSAAALASYDSNLYQASQKKHKIYHLARARFAERVHSVTSRGKTAHIAKAINKTSKSKRSKYLG